jgi:hypothetical protein
MRPPRPGRPRCWATGPAGGSCSATPSSSWPRNTDSRNWAEFRADIQSQRTTGDRPVSRLWGGSSGFASQADSLLTDLRRGDPDALARLRAHVPRYAAATDASAAELRDARLVIAREVGFGTWRELVASAEKSQRDEAERQERWRRMRPEAEAMLAGDTARLARLTAGQAGILLQMLAGREILGTKPGQALGAPRAAVDVLIGKATRLDLPAGSGCPLRPGGLRAPAARRRRQPRHPDGRHHAAGERHPLWRPADGRPAR